MEIAAGRTPDVGDADLEVAAEIVRRNAQGLGRGEIRADVDSRLRGGRADW